MTEPTGTTQNLVDNVKEFTDGSFDVPSFTEECEKDPSKLDVLRKGVQDPYTPVDLSKELDIVIPTIRSLDFLEQVWRWLDTIKYDVI